MIGYIKLHRQILHWEWYTDINTKTLFLHCLLMANHKSNTWRGMEIKTGTFASSLRKLSVETGLTVSQIRTSLSKLESTQEIAQETHTSFTIIKVLNYGVYQYTENDTIAQETHETSQSSSTPNRTPVSNKQEYKENKNDKNKDNKDIYGEFENVEMTEKEYLKLKQKTNYEEYIERLSRYIATKGKKYKSHYATILTWMSNDDKEKQEEDKPKFKTPKGVTTI